MIHEKIGIALRKREKALRIARGEQEVGDPETEELLREQIEWGDRWANRLVRAAWALALAATSALAWWLLQ